MASRRAVERLPRLARTLLDDRPAIAWKRPEAGEAHQHHRPGRGLGTNAEDPSSPPAKWRTYHPRTSASSDPASATARVATDVPLASAWRTMRSSKWRAVRGRKP